MGDGENRPLSFAMRFIQAAAFLSILCAFAGFAATTAGKSTAPKKAAQVTKGPLPATKAPATKAPATKSAAAKGPATKVGTAKGVAARGKKPAAAPVANWRTRQMNPTTDRYKEIQEALVTKGYLKNEPSGIWDADSVGALQRFQMDQKLQPSGKINAPTLIGLGLGAKSAGAPEAPALPGTLPTPANANPASPSPATGAP